MSEPRTLAGTTSDVLSGRRENRLIGFACEACGRKQASPMARCVACRSPRIVRHDLPSDGVVESFTIQRVAPEEWINDVPYAVAIVKLADGTRVMGWIPYVNAQSDLPLGSKVRFVPSYRSGIQFEKIVS